MYYIEGVENNLGIAKEFLSRGIGIEKVEVDVSEYCYTIDITIYMDANHQEYFLCTRFYESGFDCSVDKIENGRRCTAVEFDNDVSYLKTLEIAQELAVDDYLEQ